MSMRLLPVKNKVSLKVVTRAHWKWQGTEIPYVTYEELIKYLGRKLNTIGEITLPRAKWENGSND